MNPARYRLFEHADLLDVQRCEPRDWVALDDDFKDWPECCPDMYVRTDEVLGISASAVFDELQSHLARIYKVGASVRYSVRQGARQLLTNKLRKFRNLVNRLRISAASQVRYLQNGDKRAR